MLVWDEETYRRYERMASKYQSQFEKSAPNRSEARRVGVYKLIREENLTMTEKEFESTLARSRAAHSKRARAQQLMIDTNDATSNEPEAQKRNDSNVELYQAWCVAHDDVPEDCVLAHFTGYSRQSFYYARKTCKERGFSFQKSEAGGFVVTARPQPQVKVEPVRTFTEAEVQAMIKTTLEEFMHKLGK